MADIRKVKCVLNGGLEKEVVADKSKGKRRLKRERKSEQASSCSYKQPKDSQHVIPEECTPKVYEKTDQYVVIQRRVLIIEGIHRWMYCCSCNVAQERLLLSIPDNLIQETLKRKCVINHVKTKPTQLLILSVANFLLTLADLEEKCIHVAPAKRIIEGFQMEISPEAAYVKGKQIENETDHTYDKQRTNIEVFGLENNSSILCVRWQDANDTTYNIVRVQYSGLTPQLACQSCPHSSETCKHIKGILNTEESSDIPVNVKEALNQEMKWRSRYVPQSISQLKIPFDCPSEEQKRNRHTQVPNTIEDFILKLVPPIDGSCDCGSGWGIASEEADMKLYTTNDVIQVKTYYRQCLNSGECQNVKEYDGCEDQLLNMGTYLVSHKVLRNYLKQYVTQGLRYAWYSFLELLDLNYNNGFSCPECGDCPHTVVMDGVSLGLRKTFMPWKQYLKETTDNVTFDGSSHNTRVFINNAETRKLLLKFVKEGLDEKEYCQLQKLISTYQPAMTDLLNDFWESGFAKCPGIYCDLLSVLSSNYPVCGFLHNNNRIFQIFSDWRFFFQNDDSVLLEQEVPLFFKFLKNLEWKIPEFMHPIMKELVVRAQSTFVGKIHNTSDCEPGCACGGIGFLRNASTELSGRKKDHLTPGLLSNGN
ncbi:Hypothetical predicted protein [Mytilus galloprovincialis]|uniref:HMG domain-containing protein n=1 Tax=Mytilus galloprovincialis TaxID=29158 RepID=A0A8B6FQ44_MYTGA|nr:Hypothetical predicted protein [Mytilus galloprovincialis]